MPSTHLVMYSASLGLVTDSDVTAAADDIITRRNNHLIFTEPYELIGAWGSGTTLTRARLGNARLNQIGQPHLWPLERVAAPADSPIIQDFRENPVVLPQNEELTILATTDAAGPARTEFALWLAAPGWNRNLPGYRERLRVRGTFTPAVGAVGTWGLTNEIAFERDLLNGVYSVIGAYVFNAAGVAFRLQFPDQQRINNRQHRAGSLLTLALGDEPCAFATEAFGEWGRFHTFTPPSVQIFGLTGAVATEVRLDLLYLGESESLLNY